MQKNLAPYRVIYGDTDQMGVVYYANYLRWFEMGRTELLRQIGATYSSVEEAGFFFPVTEVSCRYLKPARFDDKITVETTLTALGRAVLDFSYEASTGLRPWYPSFLRRNPPKHPPSLSELRRVRPPHSSTALRPWSSAKADKILIGFGLPRSQAQKRRPAPGRKTEPSRLRGRERKGRQDIAAVEDYSEGRAVTDPFRSASVSVSLISSQT